MLSSMIKKLSVTDFFSHTHDSDVLIRSSSTALPKDAAGITRITEGLERQRVADACAALIKSPFASYPP